MKKVVIVGAGFGGLKTALALRKVSVQLTIVDRNNHHLFQPLLYQVATAGLSPADIAVPIRSILRRHKNAEVLMAEVVGVDTKNRKVDLGKGNRSLDYDFLVLATGSTHSYFGHDEWAEFAPGLKSIPDATAIRAKILKSFEKAELEADPVKQKSLMTFILVGGGPTGVEMAGSIAELASKALARDFRHIDTRSARILLIEADARILAAFPEPLAIRAAKDLNQLGVEILTNTRVSMVDKEGVVASGKRIQAHTVIWAAGVMASPVGKWLRAETDRSSKLTVHPDLTVPGHPDIYVIGDAAHFPTKDGRGLPGVASVAMQEGKYVAKHIRDRITGSKSDHNQVKAQKPRPFVYFDKGNLATIGRESAIADLGRIKLHGFIAWLAWLFIHIFYLISFKNKIIVLLEWAWAYITFERGARLITEHSRFQSVGSETAGSTPVTGGLTTVTEDLEKAAAPPVKADGSSLKKVVLTRAP